MQVIVAYDAAPGWALDVSYRFAVLAAAFVVTVTCMGAGLLVYLFAYHYVATVRAGKEAGRKKQLAKQAA